jgi:hypothetical protein
MTLKTLCFSLAALFVMGSCASDKKPTIEKSSASYKNTFDFVWDSSLAELKENWEIAKADRVKKEISTKWGTNLAPFAGKGGRDRLIVTIVTDGSGGWRADVKQETQVNNNEENPLDREKAKWESVPNDGALAARFLQNLDTRLSPDERWRDKLAR